MKSISKASRPSLETFVRDLKSQPPPAASITEIEVRSSEPVGLTGFTIRESQHHKHPTVRISPDLPVCDDCLNELFDPANPRYLYPYINCTNCGPRYSVVLALPYDRPNTTMKPWPLDALCEREYRDPTNRRFHAQPVACPACGPHYYLHPNHVYPNHDTAGSNDSHPPRGRDSSCRRDSRGERTRRLSPRLRCPESRGRSRLCGIANTAKKNLSL